jgi:hypothetical protein
MMLLLGYSASLLSTLVISAAIFSAILTVTTANRAPTYRSNVMLPSRHEAHRHHVGSKVSHAITKDKTTSVVATTRHVAEIAGKDIGKP